MPPGSVAQKDLRKIELFFSNRDFATSVYAPRLVHHFLGVCACMLVLLKDVVCVRAARDLCCRAKAYWSCYIVRTATHRGQVACDPSCCSRLVVSFHICRLLPLVDTPSVTVVCP